MGESDWNGLSKGPTLETQVLAKGITISILPYSLKQGFDKYR